MSSTFIIENCQLNFNEKMERVAGIEPAYLAWKARALPLSYTRLRHYIIRVYIILWGFIYLSQLERGIYKG